MKTMTPNQYEQEYECSFDAAIIGAVYAKELLATRKANRITNTPYNAERLVYTAFDIGKRDATAIWFFQLISGDIRIIDYFEDSMEAAPYYASILKGKDYKFDTIYLPHDSERSEAATGVTFAQVMRGNGFKVEVLKATAVEDGINAARMIFPRCYFDEKRCEAGLEALQAYQWGYNVRMDELKTAPVHNWASHGADAFRYLAVSIKSSAEAKPSLKPINYPKRAFG